MPGGASAAACEHATHANQAPVEISGERLSGADGDRFGRRLRCDRSHERVLEERAVRAERGKARSDDVLARFYVAEAAAPHLDTAGRVLQEERVLEAQRHDAVNRHACRSFVPELVSEERLDRARRQRERVGARPLHDRHIVQRWRIMRDADELPPLVEDRAGDASNVDHGIHEVPWQRALEHRDLNAEPRGVRREIEQEMVFLGQRDRSHDAADLYELTVFPARQQFRHGDVPGCGQLTAPQHTDDGPDDLGREVAGRRDALDFHHIADSQREVLSVHVDEDPACRILHEQHRPSRVVVGHDARDVHPLMATRLLHRQPPDVDDARDRRQVVRTGTRDCLARRSLGRNLAAEEEVGEP